MKGALTLANLLTLSRLALCVPIFHFLWHGAEPIVHFLLFGMAGLTDLLDGYVARRRGEESSLGEILDPVADKVLVVGTLIILALRGKFPMSWLVVLGAKELGLLIGGALLVGKAKPVIRARWLGKVSTCFLIVGILLLLLNVAVFGQALIFIGVILSLGAGLDYLYILLRTSRRD